MIAAIAALALGCGAAPVRPANDPLDPLALDCTSDDRALDVRRAEAEQRWHQAAEALDDARADDALAAFTAASCLLEGDRRRVRAMFAIGVVLEGQLRFRAAYEAFAQCLASGELIDDPLLSTRIHYLRAVLETARERLESGRDPFETCAVGAETCGQDAVCLRDYARFNDGLCEVRAGIMDDACTGICVPRRTAEAE
jgi:hypothetical protein